MSETKDNEEGTPGLWRRLANSMGFSEQENEYLNFINKPSDSRPNRLCVSISDIHLTDGTVGFQNLSIHVWDAFYSAICKRCERYSINEMTLVLDGDIVDIIRTSKWAEKGIYPWERERKAEFSELVNAIIQDIVAEHKDFFEWLRELPEKLKKDANVETVNKIVLLGNHDKELLCDQKALTYFYEKGLGEKLEDISDDYRRDIGRMYGDENLFVDKQTAPYLPFYFGDCGFRFFTTHGQWRDKENSRKVTDWSAKDGWRPEVWKKLQYSPFLLPCFGDTVAAGVLSTFIYKVKTQLKEQDYKDSRLNRIIDELDLYRPTYVALLRILDETRAMRKDKGKEVAIKIIEDTLCDCVMQWLSWSFTYKTSPILRRVGLKAAKFALRAMRLFGRSLEVKGIEKLMEVLSFFSPFRKSGVSYKELKTFPSFLPEYHHYKFQIHGEGHTHRPLQEEPNIPGIESPTTYINFGTWRYQIVQRKKRGYRRRGVLRALFILDLIDNTPDKLEGKRSYDYFTEDIIHWSDKSDTLDFTGKYQPHV